MEGRRATRVGEWGVLLGWIRCAGRRCQRLLDVLGQSSLLSESFSPVFKA